MYLLGRFFGIAAALAFHYSTASAETLSIVSRGDDNAKYAISMVNLALSKIPNTYNITITEELMTNERMVEEVIAGGKADIMWTGSSKQLEQRLIPIRIPLYKGLLGTRVCLVHRDNIDIFKHVKSISDLRAIRFGQGRGWIDAKLLEEEGLVVITTPKYEGLFRMLDGGRFDAFPRGAHEPWSEIEKRPELDLVVEPHIKLIYRLPFYIFVTPQKPDLAKALENGLKIAIEDGSFDHLFYNDPLVKNAFRLAKLDQRTPIFIDNNYLHELTPIEDKSLWLE
jgi:ABC-type amino acid transport substrate-binding protein